VQEGFFRPLFGYQGNQFILAAHSHSCNCSSTWKNKKKEKNTNFSNFGKKFTRGFFGWKTPDDSLGRVVDVRSGQNCAEGQTPP